MKIDHCGILIGGERFIALFWNYTCWEWQIEWRELHWSMGPVIISLRKVK